jgi:hypothetical protein
MGTYPDAIYLSESLACSRRGCGPVREAPVSRVCRLVVLRSQSWVVREQSKTEEVWRPGKAEALGPHDLEPGSLLLRTVRAQRLSIARSARGNQHNKTDMIGLLVVCCILDPGLVEWALSRIAVLRWCERVSPLKLIKPCQ